MLNMFMSMMCAPMLRTPTDVIRWPVYTPMMGGVRDRRASQGCWETRPAWYLKVYFLWRFPNQKGGKWEKLRNILSNDELNFQYNKEWTQQQRSATLMSIMTETCIYYPKNGFVSNEPSKSPFFPPHHLNNDKTLVYPCIYYWSQLFVFLNYSRTCKFLST